MRCNIGARTVSGESAAVTSDMTAAWLESTLPTLLYKYSLEDIYNADEFGLFYAAAPKTTLHFRTHNCNVDKFSKNRLNWLVAVYAVGGKLPLIIVGKSKKTCCF